jgi:hypothetical protein
MRRTRIATSRYSWPERQMTVAAARVRARGWAPFASVLHSRDRDFGRLAAISRADLRLIGS